ncbi:MAG: hypothetical protein QOH82_3337, partial [Mycobacterium sp.]|nr:hypothetical protein [Mycobacterium sp.]
MTLDEPLPRQDDSVRHRRIGVVPSASMLTGAAIGVLWFWIP